MEVDYFEACNFDTVSPCVFLGDPTKASVMSQLLGTSKLSTSKKDVREYWLGRPKRCGSISYTRKHVYDAKMEGSSRTNMQTKDRQIRLEKYIQVMPEVFGVVAGLREKVVGEVGTYKI